MSFSTAMLRLLFCTTAVLMFASVDSKWYHWDKHKPSYHQQPYPSHHYPQGDSYYNKTNFGSNLCQVCSTETFDCQHVFTAACSDVLKDFIVKETSTPLPSSRNPTGAPLSRSKRFLRPWWHQNWNNWNNLDANKNKTQNNGSSTTTEAPRPQCTYNVTKTCSKRKCDIKCCDDKPINSYGSCTSANLDCRNGGSPSGTGKHCLCPSGFYGTECEKRICTLKCQHGGVCRTNVTHIKQPGGSTQTFHKDYCVCVMDTYGELCEHANCSLPCKNGGKCNVGYAGSTYCSCKMHYHGYLCEKGLKPGSCPVEIIGECKRESPYIYGHYYGRYGDSSSCYHDESCPADQKCCLSKCGYRCTLPAVANATCFYNNESHKIGSTFLKDACTVCTCNKSHTETSMHGVIQCAKMLCPDPPKHCSNIITRPNQCCPVCQDPPSKANCHGNYTAPRFLNCPDTEVVLVVEKDKDFALVDLNLHTVDCNGESLDVAYDKKKLIAGIGEQNHQLVLAVSKRDLRNNYADCLFHVRIDDIQPPYFVSCPADISIDKPGPVYWENPVATDNVGLAIQPTSRHQPGQVMAKGQYIIEYWAEDYQGNVGHCTFMVDVGGVYRPPLKVRPPKAKNPNYGKGDTQPLEQGMKHTQHISINSKSLKIGTKAGIGITVIVIIVIFAAVLFVLYRRLQKNKMNARQLIEEEPTPRSNRLTLGSNRTDSYS